MGKYKLAIIMRTDLQMGKGKMCVQAGHASLYAYLSAPDSTSSIVDSWIQEGQFKIVLKVNSEDELVKVNELAHSNGLQISLVYDKGLTQVAPDTLTCIAIGPAKIEDIDKVTGNLPLL